MECVYALQSDGFKNERNSGGDKMSIFCDLNIGLLGFSDIFSIWSLHISRHIPEFGDNYIFGTTVFTQRYLGHILNGKIG